MESRMIGTINSKLYWDNRFSKDWESCLGREQSRFFARLAIDQLPAWFKRAVTSEKMTICDWGCAEADGTDVLASFFGRDKLTGIDFSDTAIKKARQYYADLDLRAEDWLSDNIGFKHYDVIFSSNTLEHFHRPYEVLEKVAQYAKKLLVLVLPYREFERIAEHHHTFVAENIPLFAGDSLMLTHASVVDSAKFASTYWPGQQVVLVYARPDWVRRAELNLSDIALQSDVDNRDERIDSLNQAVMERNEQITSLNQTVIERNEQVTSLNQTVIERNEQITNLNQAIAERDSQISALEGEISLIKASLSWRFTRPIRIAKRLLTLPFANYEARYQFAKAVYWSLPQVLRARFSSVRWAIASKHLARLASSPTAHTSPPLASNSQTWIRLANSAAKLAIIPCSFEFEELVNQRPINAAKYFADQGYFVIFVAWQWFPKERLAKGSAEVSLNIFQVPLFDFISAIGQLTDRSDPDSLYLVTLPAQPLVQTVQALRYKGVAIIYDIMDEWECFAQVGQAPWYDEQLERSLVLESDHVTAVSPPLADKFSDLRRDIIIIGNGYSTATIGEKSKFAAIQTSKTEVIVGYFGHLTDAWFDWELLFDVAAKLPGIKFEIIGYGEPDWLQQRVLEAPNIHLLGKVQPLELQGYARYWSAALIPFRANGLAEAVDPIKIYEYLFFGLPVVAAGIRHVERYPYTNFVTGRDEFVEAIKEAARTEVDICMLESFLAETTWKERFANTLKLLEANSIQRLYVH